MKLIKTTDDYKIYQRRDERYAVKNKKGLPVNADEKIRILLEEGLIKLTEPSAPAEEETAEAAATEESVEEAPSEDAESTDEASEEEAKDK